MTSILIGIPTLNGSDRLCRALESIAAHTNFDRWNDVKVLICDDGSSQTHLDSNKYIISGGMTASKTLRERAGMEMWMNRERQGIATSWNTLTRFKPHEITVLLNDDIEVVDDWLEVIVYSLMHNAHIGMLGLNAYSGIQKSQLRELHPGAFEHVRTPRIDFNEARLIGGDSLVSSHGFAFAFRRAYFDQVGGFDQNFKCFFEELDFGLRLRKAGYFNYMASYPTLFHLGGATTSKIENMDANAEMAASRTKFQEKWGNKTVGQLRSELPSNPPPCKEWNTHLRNWP